MDNPEGQVTYPIYIGRPGYLPVSGYTKDVRCVFIFAFHFNEFRIHNPCFLRKCAEMRYNAAKIATAKIR